MNARTVFSILKEAFNHWLADGAPALGAALAYYAIFSITPLVLLLTATAGVVFGEEAVSGELYNQLRILLGSDGARTVQDMVAAVRTTDATPSLVSWGTAFLVVGATAFFGQLQAALDRVWEVRARSDRSWWSAFRDRWASVAMLLGMGFLLMVSLMLSTIIALLAGKFLAGRTLAILSIETLNFLSSWAVIVLLFALMYRILPNVYMQWRDVWFGSLVTALFFVIGKSALAWYIGYSAVTTTYGAAGSLLAALLWIYYSSQILLFGAEVTQVATIRRGGSLTPKPGFESMSCDNENGGNGERGQSKRQSADEPTTAYSSMAHGH